MLHQNDKGMQNIAGRLLRDGQELTARVDEANK